MTKIKMPRHIHLYKRIDLVPSWKQKLSHDHKYYRPSHLVFACQKPACSSWIPINRAFGKLCECNRCHNPFILDKLTMTLAKPHCQDCIKHKKIDTSQFEELTKDI